MEPWSPKLPDLGCDVSKETQPEGEILLNRFASLHNRMASLQGKALSSDRCIGGRSLVPSRNSFRI